MSGAEPIRSGADAPPSTGRRSVPGVATPATRFAIGIAAAAASLSLGVLAAWPIYETARLWLVAGVALALGSGVAWARDRWRLRLPVVAVLVLVLFALTVVPVAVPQSLRTGFLTGLLDGLAAVVLGWKQLLTLELPVGSYRTMLVPVYLVFLLTSLLVGIIARRRSRAAAFAAIPMLVPIAFGTVFGASALSAPLHLGPLTLVAPREIALWLAAALLACVWIVWTSGADRRAALRLGRIDGDTAQNRGGALRVLTGAGIVVAALLAGAAMSPLLDSGARAVPRDSVDPEIVVRDRPSPLAAYRTSKRDDAIDVPLFSVSAEGALPERLRLAVLDTYDGRDFHVGDDAAARFTRFPSGDRVSDPTRVSVVIDEGYSDIWAPTAPLGSSPTFSGGRANELADAFYVNRETGAAILIPGGDAAAPGLTDGDGYTAEMETGAGSSDLGAPSSTAALIDLDTAPELATWIERQEQTATPEGLAELIDRLRQRGYLSHSMTDGEGDRLWLERLAEQYGTRFESSAGGHSLARIELLFSQLNAQQSAAGEKAKPAQLIAAIGDDEQFATAAALVARALGYDSRVVVGVRLGAEDDGVPGVPNCSADCTGENLAAWIEVRGDRGRWVAIDATPQVEQQPQRLEQGEQLPEFPTTPEERDANEVDPPIGLGDQGSESEEPADETAAAWLLPLLKTVGLSVATLLLLLLPFLFLPLAKRRRARRRRMEKVPELRALGAWEEMQDRARDAGADIPANASRASIGDALGTAPAIWAATQVDRAVFSAGGISAETADQLWDAADADRAERSKTMKFRARMRAAYSLRSYGLGRARRRRAQMEGANE